MATISKLSILVDANATGVTKGLDKVRPQLKTFQLAVTSAFGSAAAAGVGAVVALFTIEKAISRVKRAFADAKRLTDMGLITKKEANAVTAMQSAWKGMGDGVSAFILKIGAQIAPTFLVVLDNLSAVTAGLVSAEGFAKGFGEWVEWSAGAFANLQSIVSGAFMMWQTASDLFFGQWILKLEMVKAAMETVGGDLFDNDGSLKAAEQSLKAIVNNMVAGHQMLQDGIAGKPGQDLLAQIEAKRKLIENHTITPFIVKPEVKEMMDTIKAMQPAAHTLGSSGAMSAINQARREADKEANRIGKQQIAELKAIRRAVEKPQLQPANF